jgi:hypothetical protein
VKQPAFPIQSQAERSKTGSCFDAPCIVTSFLFIDAVKCPALVAPPTAHAKLHGEDSVLDDFLRQTRWVASSNLAR